MAGLNLTTFNSMLKEHYTDDYIQNLVYKKNPLFALMKKMEDFGGRNLRVPLIYGNPQGRSATFSQAQARSVLTSSRVTDFILTRVRDYSIATIDNETIEASKGNENAFMEALTTEIDGAINTLTRSLAIGMYGTGYGDVGQIGSISGATITLAVPETVTNFEVGQMLDDSATQGASVLRAYGTSGNGLIITGVNRSTGVLTFGFNVTDATNGIPTAVAGDYLFVTGDRQNSATPSALKVGGLEGWLPAATPGSTSWFGVDRTVDPTRLAGQRFDGTALPIEEALIEGASLVAREGGQLDHYFMNFKQWSNLEKALGSKVQYVDLQATPTVGFRAMQIAGPGGFINVVPDQNCPTNRSYGLQLDCWKLNSLGKAVRVIDTDGLQMLRQTTADGVEVRYGFYGNIGCSAPGYNINVQL